MNVILSRRDGEGSQNAIPCRSLRSFAPLRMTVAVLGLLCAIPAFPASEKKIDRDKAAPQQHSVTLDVKDAEVREILKSMQRQCGIKNLVVDPDVQGKGTFYLRDVPCDKALDTVLRTLRLRSVTYSSSVITVEKRP